MDINGIDWLDAIRRHYGSTDVTPWDVASEFLLGQTDTDNMARSINRRGRKVGDTLMATTTAADCADAVEELISFGFLESVFSASSPEHGETGEEHVLELRMP